MTLHLRTYHCAGPAPDCGQYLTQTQTYIRSAFEPFPEETSQSESSLNLRLASPTSSVDDEDDPMTLLTRRLKKENNSEAIKFEDKDSDVFKMEEEEPEHPSAADERFKKKMEGFQGMTESMRQPSTKVNELVRLIIEWMAVHRTEKVIVYSQCKFTSPCRPIRPSIALVPRDVNARQ